MEITLETRKPIDHLMVSDFSVFPVWEFAADEEGVEGQDETWVRAPDGNSWSHFTAPDGQVHGMTSIRLVVPRCVALCEAVEIPSIGAGRGIYAFSTIPDPMVVGVVA